MTFCFFFFFFFFLVSIFKVKPQPLCFPYIHSRFLCPVCQVVTLRAKIIFTKSSIDFTAVRIRDILFLLSIFKVKPQPLCFPYIHSRFLCPVCQVVTLRAKIIFTKSSIDFTAVRIRDILFLVSIFKVKPQPLCFPYIHSRFLCPLCQVVTLRAKIIFTKSSIDFTAVPIRDILFLVSIFKVKPQPLCFPYIHSRFLCPVCQVVTLRAKIIFTKSSIDFTAVRIRDICFWFFFFLVSIFKVKPQPLCFPYIHSRFLCPVCQVVTLRAKIIFTKSSIDFTAVRIRDILFLVFFFFRFNFQGQTTTSLLPLHTQ